MKYVVHAFFFCCVVFVIIFHYHHHLLLCLGFPFDFLGFAPVRLNTNFPYAKKKMFDCETEPKCETKPID